MNERTINSIGFDWIGLNSSHSLHLIRVDIINECI